MLVLFICTILGICMLHTVRAVPCGSTSPWYNNTHPSPATNYTDSEEVPPSDELDKICDKTAGGVLQIHCKDERGEPFTGVRNDSVSNFYLATCVVVNGLKCTPYSGRNTTCPDFAIQFSCDCLPTTTSKTSATVTKGRLATTPSKPSTGSRSTGTVSIGNTTTGVTPAGLSTTVTTDDILNGSGTTVYTTSGPVGSAKSITITDVLSGVGSTADSKPAPTSAARPGLDTRQGGHNRKCERRVRNTGTGWHKRLTLTKLLCMVYLAWSLLLGVV